MNNNVLISIVVVVLVIVGLVVLSNSSRKNTKEDVTNKIEMAPEKTSGTLTDGTFSFSSNESRVQWEGKKTLIKDWVDTGFISVVSGVLNITDGSLVSGNVIIDMNSIRATKTGANAGEDKLSGHLKSADFFDAEVHPTSEFKVTSVSLIENNKYNVVGDITIKGITKSIEFPADVYMNDNKIFVNGEVVINRTDFNVRYGSKSFFSDLGDNVIDDSFILKLSLVATK